MADECMVQSKTNADDAPCPQPQPQKTSLVSQIPLPSDTHSVLQTPIPLAEKYQYIQKLGQGSQAKVFLAQRLSDKKNVAIKQLDIASVSNWKSYDLFQREAAVLASLHVDGVARFYEAIECLDDAHPCSYLVQEYIEGKSLGDMLKSGHRFSIDEVYDILIQMLTILNQLHSRPHPVIHRDIKPSNIMLTPTDDGYRVTLIDFGAVANPQVQRGGSTVAGTYGYMSPEQMMGHPQPASDIYSLAAVAVELFTGVSPASMPVKDFHLIFEPQMQSHPHMLVETLRKMLDPDIAKRECNCLGLIETFKQYKNGNFERKDDIVAMDSKYDTKLSEVSNMVASGNIALWQALPDQTPRNVPQAYRFANWSEIKAAFGFIDTLSYKNYYTVSALAGIVCAILVVLGIVENAGAFSVISLTIAALLFCLMVASFIGARKRFKIFQRPSNLLEFHTSSQICFKMAQKRLQRLQISNTSPLQIPSQKTSLFWHAKTHVLRFPISSIQLKTFVLKI